MSHWSGAGGRAGLLDRMPDQRVGELVHPLSLLDIDTGDRRTTACESVWRSPSKYRSVSNSAPYWRQCVAQDALSCGRGRLPLGRLDRLEEFSITLDAGRIFSETVSTVHPPDARHLGWTPRLRSSSVGPWRSDPEDLAPQRVDGLALLVHDVVVLEQMLAECRSSAPRRGAGRSRIALFTQGCSMGTSSFHPQPLHPDGELVAAKMHGVILQRHEEVRRPRVAWRPERPRSWLSIRRDSCRSVPRM